MHWSLASVHGELPHGVRSHTTTLVGSKLFVFGGSNMEDKFSGLMIFDTGAVREKPSRVSSTLIPSQRTSKDE